MTKVAPVAIGHDTGPEVHLRSNNVTRRDILAGLLAVAGESPSEPLAPAPANLDAFAAWVVDYTIRNTRERIAAQLAFHADPWEVVAYATEVYLRYLVHRTTKNFTEISRALQTVEIDTMVETALVFLNAVARSVNA